MDTSKRESSAEPSVYRIRLIGPWDLLRGLPDSGASWERVRLPASWQDLLGNYRGVATFRRTFHAPSGLEEGDRLWIELPPRPGKVVHASLNDSPLQADLTSGSPRLEITETIEEFNTLLLSLEWTADASPGGLWQPVQLVIESLDSSGSL